MRRQGVLRLWAEAPGLLTPHWGGEQLVSSRSCIGHRVGWERLELACEAGDGGVERECYEHSKGVWCCVCDSWDCAHPSSRIACCVSKLW